MRRAFTLIELMIVVAIFAVISAVLVPLFLRAGHHAEQRAARQSQQPQLPKGGELPVLERGTVQLQLITRSWQVGLDAVQGYEVTHEAALQLHPLTKGKTRLELPFPREAGSIREASLEFLADGRRYEPEEVYYAPAGVVWVGQLPAGLEEVRFTFVAQGQGAFVYDLPEVARVGNLEVSVRGDLDRTRLAPGSLLPTERGSDCLCWHFANLVSRLPIALEPVPAPGPLARVGTLFRLTGLAVLLFGLGLWYLAELYRPGALRQFRLGGFFLLALSYSTFFVVFAVLGFHQDVSALTAFWVALVCWAPPLVLHVSHVVDRRFALRLALPLGFFTLLLVVNGVYGGPWRDYFYLAAAVGTVAFLTTSYQRWLRIRAELVERARAVREAEQEQERSRVLEEERAQQARREQAQTLLEQAAAALDQPDPRALRSTRRTVRGLCQKVGSSPEAADALRRALERLESLRRELPPRPASGCCMACGHGGAQGNFCPACGQRQARTVVCGGCATAVVLPVHLWQDEPRLHCPGCGVKLDCD